VQNRLDRDLAHPQSLLGACVSIAVALEIKRDASTRLEKLAPLFRMFCHTHAITNRANPRLSPLRRKSMESHRESAALFLAACIGLRGMIEQLASKLWERRA
jgi:hypothetical protein